MFGLIMKEDSQPIIFMLITNLFTWENPPQAAEEIMKVFSKSQRHLKSLHLRFICPQVRFRSNKKIGVPL